MKKSILLSSAICLHFIQVFACSCADNRSFTSQVYSYYSSLADVVEFEIIKKETNNITVKILKAWKENLSIGQEIKIWTLPGGSDAMCYPSTNVNYFKDSNRGMALLKTTDEGLYYMPPSTCGRVFLEVENDSVKGATFGLQIGFYSSFDTREYDMPYDTFIDRFNGHMAIITDIEVSPISTSAIEISPNPTSTQLKLQGHAGKIKIIGTTTSWEVNTQPDGSIDVSQLPAGSYVLECLLPDRTIRKRFIKI